MKAKVTLKNISNILDLSISTVSRALKSHPDISDETRQRVMEVASMLEYEPNTYAISLRTNKSKILGLIVPAISNYFYHSFIASLEEESRNAGYTLLILQSGDNPDLENENLKLCRLNRVAGVFVSITPHTKNLQPFVKLEELGIPVVFFDKVPANDIFNRVTPSDKEAARMAAERIIDSGRKKVLAIFGNKDLSITQKREQSLLETFQKLAPAVRIVSEYANTNTEAEQITKNYTGTRRKPEVIFSMSDEILSGIMKVIQQKKLKVPEDIAVITISNGFFPKLYYPEITFVETSGHELGKLAFKRMNDHFAGKTFVQSLTIPSRLIEGGSI